MQKNENYLKGYDVNKQKPLNFESDFDSIVTQRGKKSIIFALSILFEKKKKDVVNFTMIWKDV